MSQKFSAESFQCESLAYLSLSMSIVADSKSAYISVTVCLCVFCLFVCSFVRLLFVSLFCLFFSAVDKASNFARRFIGVQGRKSPIL